MSLRQKKEERSVEPDIVVDKVEDEDLVGDRYLLELRRRWRDSLHRGVRNFFGRD
jgi:hypothetical protein